jgi:hypothetical protein
MPSSTEISVIDHKLISSSECGRDQHTKKMPAKAFSKEQCIAAFEIFNTIQHSQSNLQIIWPVLTEILQSLILRMLEVEHYFSYIGKKLELPVDVTEQK